MTTQTTKIRLVRCPKCKLLLPEPEIPVYKCGGCGAILQAKIRKTNNKSTVLNHDRSDANGEGRVDKMLDEREINGPNEATTVCARAEFSSDSGSNGNQETSSARGGPAISTGCTSSQDYHPNEETTPRGESSSVIASPSSQDLCPNQETTTSGKPDVSIEKNENSFHDYNEKLPCGQTFSPELPNLLELGSFDDQETAAESTQRVEQFQCDYNADQKSRDYENESRVSHKKCISGRSFLEDFSSSGECMFHVTNGSSPERGPNRAGDEANRSLGQLDRVDQTKSENCTRELPEQQHCLSEIPSLIVGKKGDENAFTSSKGGTFDDDDVDIQLAQHVGSSGECKSEGHRIVFSPDASSPKDVPLASEIVPLIQSQELDTNILVNEDISRRNIENLEKEDTTKKEETGSLDAEENPLHGKILLNNAESSGISNMGACQRSIAPAIGQYCVTDSQDNLPLGSSSSEFGPKRRELSKSLTKCYYGHDGSASAYEGFEDRVPNLCAKPPRRKIKHANYKNSHGLPREDGPRANDSHTGNLEMQYKPTNGTGLNEIESTEPETRYQARKVPIMPERSHPTLKYRTKQDYLHDPRSSGHSNGCRMREDKDGHISSLPFIPNYLHMDQRKESPTLYPLDPFQHYSAIGSSDVPSYAEPDKMELLRMVNELKEELNRIQISNSMFPHTMAREEKFSPTHCDHHLRPVAEMPSDLSYPRYARRYSHERGLAHLNQLPRMAFTGDAANYMRHVERACLHCHPQDWQYSVQLPSHTVCRNKVHSNNCNNSPRSTSSCPHRCNSSEFSVRDHDTMSVEQRHRDSGIRNLQLRERYQSKRHVRPVAGGNPIIACYSCSVLLQLPADFILLGRRYHKLRCNACGKVLKFALQSGKHIVPSVPEAIAPPPSMVDYSSEYIARGNHASASHSNNNADVDPVSFSEDYGVYFERSYSTEADPSIFIPPRHLIEGTSRARKMSLGDTVVAGENRKMKSVLREYQKCPSSMRKTLELWKGSLHRRDLKGESHSLKSRKFQKMEDLHFIVL